MIHIDKQIKQLTQAEKRRIIEEKLRISGQLSNRSLSKIIGCSPTTVGAVRRELQVNNEQFGQQHTDSWNRHPYFLKNRDKLLDGRLSDKSLIALRNLEVLDKMQEIGSLSPRYAQRLIHKERKAANKSFEVICEDDIRVFQGDVRTGLPEIADCSVSLCFVDMPYHRKAIEELTPHIATTASRILSDGGSLLLMVGGSHLDIVFDKLTKTADKALRFQWDVLYVCPRGTPLIQGRRVTTAVKHIIWMSKNKYTGPIQHDILYSPPDDADKALYYHGQSVAGIKLILERWSSDGDTICDFMCGGGSTVQAALELGNRKVIASDINPDAVAITKQCVAEMFGA